MSRDLGDDAAGDAAVRAAPSDSPIGEPDEHGPRSHAG